MSSLGLHRILARLRPPTSAELDALGAYRDELSGILTRATTIADEWIELSQVESEDERLANRAAVFRWELVRLREQARQLEAPRPARREKEDLDEVLEDAARACQLLATGTRFHKSETVCDGQTLLTRTADEIRRIGRRVDALLSAS